MTSSTARSTRQQFLARCMRISVMKRWPLPLAVGLFVLSLGWILLFPWWVSALLTVLGIAVSSGVIALDSYRRHRWDS